MKVAIIHYWLVKMRGGEKVLENICDIFPNADIFTHVLDEKKISSNLKKHNIYTTFINRLPFASKIYKYYLFLMPFALKGINLDSYDLVITSESGPAKGIKKNINAKHVCYCHSPMRYIWDMKESYLNNFNLFEKIGYKTFYKYLKNWDIKSSNNIDLIISNSSFVKNRIKKYWNKNSKVLNPSINFNNFKNRGNKEYFLLISEHVSYKRIDIAINTFNKIDKELIIIGNGPLLKTHKSMAKNNIKFLGYVDDIVKINYLSSCKALIFPGIEDFGIVPLEACASGKVVIAFNGGGVLEYLNNRTNSILFDKQEPQSLADAINKFEKNYASYNPNEIIDSISDYSDKEFKFKFKKEIDQLFSNN